MGITRKSIFLMMRRPSAGLMLSDSIVWFSAGCISGLLELCFSVILSSTWSDWSSSIFISNVDYRSNVRTDAWYVCCQDFHMV